MKDEGLVRTQGFIGGKWRDASDGATISVISALAPLVSSPENKLLMSAYTDPATNEEIGTIPEMGVKETQEAISAARAAFNSWKLTTAKAWNLIETTLSCPDCSSVGTT